MIDLYQSRIYRTWASMKARCLNPNVASYKRYGGRGITVCARWQQFENFYEDMRSGYSDDLTIDRIDNTKGYYPENCKWATRKEQARNTRNIDRARRYTFQGQTKTIREWSETLGINRTTLHMRLRNYGWPIDRAMGMYHR